jgi:hypothetical protein
MFLIRNKTAFQLWLAGRLAGHPAQSRSSLQKVRLRNSSYVAGITEL